MTNDTLQNNPEKGESTNDQSIIIGTSPDNEAEASNNSNINNTHSQNSSGVENTNEHKHNDTKSPGHKYDSTSRNSSIKNSDEEKKNDSDSDSDNGGDLDSDDLNRIESLGNQNLTRVITDVVDFVTYQSLNNEIDQALSRKNSKSGGSVGEKHLFPSSSINHYHHHHHQNNTQEYESESESRLDGNIIGDGNKDSNEQDNNERSEPPYTIFSENELLFITVAASCAAVFSTISVPIYLSALTELANDFHVTTELINITVTVYSIVQGISPALWGSLADSIGRRPVLMACLIVYIGANIGLALAKNYGFLIGFRILQAAGIASTIPIGSGVIGDVTERRNRGFYMGIFSGLSMVGNAVGPLIGGALAGTLGWRSIFWFLVISASVSLVFMFIMMPETSRKKAGNGSIVPKSRINKAPYMSLRRYFIKSAKTQEPNPETLMRPSPIRIYRTFELFLEKDVFIILLPNAIHYTTWFMLITAQSTLLVRDYHFSTIQLGLSYLANGGGSILGSLISGRVMNYFYQKEVKRFQAQHGKDTIINPRDGKFNIHRARLLPLPFISTLQIIGCLVFGWTIEYKTHYIVPILFTALVSFASLFSYNLSSTLIVDLFPKDSSSASAAVNLTRCLLCAAGIAAVDKMDEAMGTGGTFTLMSGFLFLSWGLNFYEIRHGPKFQQERLKKQKEKEKENEMMSQEDTKRKDEKSQNEMNNLENKC